MKKILIFIDRDGTIIYDKKSYPGSQKNWKSKIKFLPKVIQGLKLLNKIPNSEIRIITNQSGIAIKEISLLTRKRAEEVNKEIIRRLSKKKIYIGGSKICPHVNYKYVKEHPQFTFYKNFVGNYSCIKPSVGMIKSTLKEKKLKRKKVKIYVLGDRISDVKTASNIDGMGILIPFANEPQPKNKIKKNVYVAKDFLDAANYILCKEKIID